MGGEDSSLALQWQVWQIVALLQLLLCHLLPHLYLVVPGEHLTLEIANHRGEGIGKPTYTLESALQRLQGGRCSKAVLQDCPQAWLKKQVCCQRENQEQG